ncbi:MAG: PAS domain S-box protein [Pseudomonadota bacterium]
MATEEIRDKKNINDQEEAPEYRNSKEAQLENERIRAHLENAVQMARLGPWEYDVANDLFTFNDHFYRIFRTTARQEGGYTMSWAQYARRFVHPDDMAVVREEIQKVIEKTDLNFSRKLEHRMLYADGTVGHISVRLFIVKDADGRLIKVYGVNQDITDRKRAEEALKQSEATLSSILQTAPVGICIVKNRVCQSMNAFLGEKNLGYSEHEIAGKVTRMIYESDEEYERVGQELYTKLLERGLTSTETRLRRRDGVFRDVVLTAAPLRSDDQSVVVVIHDITERKKAEERLAQSEEQYRSLVNSMQDVIYRADSDGNLVYISPSAPRLIGYNSSEEMIGLDISSNLYYHPEDRQKFLKTLRESGRVSNYEVILKRKDNGNPVIVSTTSQYYYDKDGRILGVEGIFRDISERKRVEMALKESEKKYRELVQNANSIILRMDSQGNIGFFNEFAQRFFGYSEKEVLGKNVVGTIFSERDNAGSDLKRMIYDIGVHPDGYTINEYENIKRDGSQVWISWTNSAIRDSKGNVAEILCVGNDVTDRKRSDEALKESEKKYRELYDFLPIPVFEIDFEGTINSMNRAVYKTFRGTVEDFNRRINIWQFHSPEGVVKATKHIQKLFLGEQTAGTEFDLKRLDGSVFPVILISSVICRDGKPVGIRGAIIDITQRRQKEEELRLANAFLDSIVENIPDMIFLKDAKELRFVRFNRAVENLLGYSRLEMLGKTDYDFFPKEQADFFAEKDQEALLRNEVVDIPEETMLTHNKGVRILHTKKVPILNAKGEPEYVLGISEDITERKRAEYEKEKLQAQLLQAQRMEAVGTLAGGIAHDFNNILGGIIGYAELAMMNQTPDPENKQHVYLRRVLEAGNRAKDLVRQILKFSRGSIPAMVPISLGPIVKESINLLQSILPKNITVQQHVTADPDKITGDPTQVHQVIMNLCTNAYHAMRDTGGLLTIDLENTRIESPRESMSLGVPPGDYIRLCVSDTGHGIAPELLGRIFEPYFTTKKTSDGTGLGLSVTMGIVKSHNGLIEVASGLCKGTRFDLYFPATSAAEMEMSVPAGPIPACKQEKILVVDDEAFFLDVLKENLLLLGYQVTANQSSVKSLEVFNADPDGFDLLITDHNMPEMTGIQLVAEIRKNNKDIPIILCTGYSETDIEHAAKYYGISRVLLKPLTAGDLACAVHEVLAVKRAGTHGIRNHH